MLEENDYTAHNQMMKGKEIEKRTLTCVFYQIIEAFGQILERNNQISKDSLKTLFALEDIGDSMN